MSVNDHRVPPTLALDLEWHPERPRILVVACSDGRLQEATDAFLSRALGIRHYDRFYVPGGGGGLCASGSDFMRAHNLRRECRFLVDAHRVEHVVLLLHGPASDGPAEAVCADYTRKMSWARPAEVRAQQERDIRDLLVEREEIAGTARVSAYRLEVTSSFGLSVATLHEERAARADLAPISAPAGPTSPHGDGGGEGETRAVHLRRPPG